MSGGLCFTLKAAPALRVDLRTLSLLAQADAAALAAARVGHGRDLVPLGEFFDVSAQAGEGWRFVGDLSRFDRLGWQWAGGTIEVEGSVGDQLGTGMSAGAIVVHGDARDQAGCEMSGGRLEIQGSVGDFAASALPGSMDGMRGGELLVRGQAGARFGDRMRRGSALVVGDAGEHLASRMVAGTIAIGGRAAGAVGYGMRRGTVVFAGPAPAVPPTFVPGVVDTSVFWQLLSRDLARHGGPFATLPQRRIQRHLGDLSAGGKGELVFVS